MPYDSVRKMIKILNTYNTKIYKIPKDLHEDLMRITYRNEGRIIQFFIFDPKLTTTLFKSLKTIIANMQDKLTARKVDRFLGASGLLVRSPNGPMWKY
jgi:hypothetical protein